MAHSSSSSNAKTLAAATRPGRGVWLGAVLAAALAAGLAVSWMRGPAPPPPELGTIPAFTLTDQSGEPFGSQALAGKVWIADFIFTRCPTICPALTAKMARLQKQARQRGLAVEFVSFSVDPEHDTPERLKAFGRKHGADFGNWHFLTGTFDAIKSTVTDAMKISMGRDSAAEPVDPEGVLHGTHFVLVDGRQTIRGYYRSKDAAELQQLLDDAARLGS